MDDFGGLVAQSVEQCPFKALVESSSLSQPTTFSKRRAIFRARRKMSRANFPPTRRPVQTPPQNHKSVQIFPRESDAQFSPAIFVARENWARNGTASENPRA